MLSESGINKMLQNWINSAQGQKYFQSKGFTNYDKETQYRIALELQNDLLRAMEQLVIGFNSSPVISDVSNNCVRITFPSESLFRPSLERKDGKSTGSDVYDIIGLFTQGWSYSKEKRPFGYWVGKEGLGIIGARSSQKGNPIISKTIENFKSKYPNVVINYPNRWQ